MNILQALLDDALRSLIGTSESLRVDNIILGKSLYTIKGCDTIFDDMNFCLVLLENGYGFSYFQGEINYDIGRFVNREITESIDLEIPLYLKVAFTDALYSVANIKSTKISKSLLVGNLRQKAIQRAKELMQRIPNGSKVLLIGAVAEIAEQAALKDINLTVIDLEPQKIGLELYCSQIESSGESDFLKQKIMDSDYVVATGMIFVSDTADEIFRLAAECDTKLIMYMETGSNFGQELVKFGAEFVLSEYFPYYDFHGDTKFSIFERIGIRQNPMGALATQSEAEFNIIKDSNQKSH